MIDLERDGGALLDRDPRQFAVALGGMAITDIEKPAFDMHRKVKDSTGSDIRQVHVATVVVRLHDEMASISGETPMVPMNGS